MDLTDTILIPKTSVGVQFQPPPTKDADTEGDGKLGVEDAFFTLRFVSGIDTNTS